MSEGRPLRVAFDDQAFVAQQRGGVTKSFVEIIKALPEVGIEPVVLSRATRNRHLAESGLVPAAPPRGRLAERVAWVTWRLVGRPREQSRRLPPYDVLHQTFTHPSYLRLGHGPRVVSMYDFMPERFPDLFPLGNPHFAKRTFARGADAIVCISQATEDDVAHFYGPGLLAKSTVVPLGIGESFLSPTLVPMELPEEYLLFVGVRRGYKEFDRFVEAAGPVLRERPAMSVVIVGGGPLTEGETAALHAAGMGGRYRHLSPSDDEMPTVYGRAAAFVFPSLYEGFGLPTLEALASGTPVVLADAGCSQEVGGPLAHLFRPGDAGALRATIEEALQPAAQQRAAAEGPAWAGRFTWRNAAERLAAVYREVLARTAPARRS